MAINFPDSPSVNDTVTQGDHTWIWDGTTWKLAIATAIAPAGSNTQVQYNSSGAFAGSANFTFDGSAAVVKGTVTVGVDDTGHDVKFFGATSGHYMEWDQSADTLNVVGKIIETDNLPSLAIADTGDHYAQDDLQCEIHLAGRYHSGTADPFADAYSDAKIQLFKDNSDGTGGSALSFLTSATGGGGLTRKLTIKKDGKVGIGTTTPMRKLDVWSELLLHNSDDAWLLQADGGSDLDFWFQDSYTSGDSGWTQKVMFVGDQALTLRVMGQANNQGAYMSFDDSDGDIMSYVGSPGNDDLQLKGTASGGYLYIGSGGNWKFYSTSSSVGGFLPYTDDTFDLGASTFRWDNIYATSGTVNSSDINLKKDIADTTLGLDFINALRPVEYKWKDGSRKHQGFIAQEVETVLDAQDVASDQGMWVLNTVKEGTKIVVPVTDENGMPQKTEVDNEERQSLRYTELIAPLVKAVQELTTRVATLEGG